MFVNSSRYDDCMLHLEEKYVLYKIYHVYSFVGSSALISFIFFRGSRPNISSEFSGLRLSVTSPNRKAFFSRLALLDIFFLCCCGVDLADDVDADDCGGLDSSGSNIHEKDDWANVDRVGTGPGRAGANEFASFLSSVATMSIRSGLEGRAASSSGPGFDSVICRPDMFSPADAADTGSG